MKKAMIVLFLSCLRATELIEKKFNFKLSIGEKLQLKMHKMMCSACSNFDKQSTLIEGRIAKIEEERKPELSQDIQSLKEEILAKLAEQTSIK